MPAPSAPPQPSLDSVVNGMYGRDAPPRAASIHYPPVRNPNYRRDSMPMQRPNAPPAHMNASQSSMSASQSNMAAVQDNMAHLEALLRKHDVTICEAHEMCVLQDHKIIVVADDSGSMQLSGVPMSERRLGRPCPTRWDELKETIQTVCEIVSCFDAEGTDVFFLNRSPVLRCTPGDARLAAALGPFPSGSTPLTECVSDIIARHSDSERPVLFLIATDGEPNGGPSAFQRVLSDAIRKRTCTGTFKFQILACTDDEDSIGWLNEFDKLFKEVDVTDDYYSEFQEVRKTGRCPRFTKGDWVLKALLGPIISKFDSWDERVEPEYPVKQKRKSLKKSCAIM